jgi:hypothetical protein
MDQTLKIDLFRKLSDWKSYEMKINNLVDDSVKKRLSEGVNNFIILNSIRLGLRIG